MPRFVIVITIIVAGFLLLLTVIDQISNASDLLDFFRNRLYDTDFIQRVRMIFLIMVGVGVFAVIAIALKRAGFVDFTLNKKAKIGKFEFDDIVMAGVFFYLGLLMTTGAMTFFMQPDQYRRDQEIVILIDDDLKPNREFFDVLGGSVLGPISRERDSSKQVIDWGYSFFEELDIGLRSSISNGADQIVIVTNDEEVFDQDAIDILASQPAKSIFIVAPQPESPRIREAFLRFQQSLNVFRVGADSKTKARVAAQFLIYNGLSEFAIIHSGSESAQKVASEFADVGRALGLRFLDQQETIFDCYNIPNALVLIGEISSLLPLDSNLSCLDNEDLILIIVEHEGNYAILEDFQSARAYEVGPFSQTSQSGDDLVELNYVYALAALRYGWDNIDSGNGLRNRAIRNERFARELRSGGPTIVSGTGHIFFVASGSQIIPVHIVKERSRK